MISSCKLRVCLTLMMGVWAALLTGCSGPVVGARIASRGMAIATLFDQIRTREQQRPRGVADDLNVIAETWRRDAAQTPRNMAAIAEWAQSEPYVRFESQAKDMRALARMFEGNPERALAPLLILP